MSQNIISGIGSRLLNMYTKKTLLIQNGSQLSKSLFVRYMAYDSSNKAHQRIEKLIDSNDQRIFVFMKGTPQEPACRFSGMVAALMEVYKVKYNSFNVLEDEEIREAVKSYSDWPTIPQVYLDKSFVGGCDILMQMHQNGELAKTFGPTDNPSNSKVSS